jgi:hypothetical protein
MIPTGKTGINRENRGRSVVMGLREHRSHILDHRTPVEIIGIGSGQPTTPTFFQKLSENEISGSITRVHSSILIKIIITNKQKEVNERKANKLRNTHFWSIFHGNIKINQSIIGIFTNNLL